MKPTKLQDLLEQSKNGVFALINEQDCKVDVRHGTNLLRSIARLVEHFKNNSVETSELMTDSNKLELVILEKDVPDLQLAYSKWISYYLEKGYSLYRSRLGVQYKVRIDIDYVPEIKQHKYFFIVQLESKANSFVVGIFDNNEGLQEFIQKYYNTGVTDIVYSTSTYTVQYLTKTPIDR